tara:strand:+ start:938 stop:1630 length:693 start_codon:yes stop_codon:yes gene_type:complete
MTKNNCLLSIDMLQKRSALKRYKGIITMPLEIIGHPRSNFVRTVRMVAHEKGVAYEHIPEMPHSDVIKSLHPMGQIPAMRHNGLELFESMAIARYIDTVYEGPKMVPSDPAEAGKIIQWASFAQTTVDRLVIRQYVVQHMFNKDEKGNVIRDEIEKAIRGFPKVFGILNNAVSSGCYGSDAFTIADCFLLPMLNSAQRYPEGKEAIKNSENLKKYFDTHSERPSYTATAP